MLMLKKMLLGIAAVGLGAAAVADMNLPRTVNPAKWQWKVDRKGALTIQVGDNSYRLDSQYSYPQMPENGWVAIPGKKTSVKKNTDGTTVIYKGKFYTVERNIVPLKNRLSVKETVRNVSGADLAVAYNHVLVSDTQVPDKKLLIGGVSTCTSPAEPDSPPHNSTMFFGGDANTLGWVIEDDYARLQLYYYNENSSFTVKNRSFCLEPGGSYTFAYSFYPVSTGDYWDFINTVRNDWNLNFKLDGNLLLASSPHKQLCDIGAPSNEVYRNLFRQYKQNMGVKYVSATNGIWLGNSSLYSVPGTPSFAKQYGSLDLMMERYKNALSIAKGIDPAFRPFALVQSIFAGQAYLDGDTEIPQEDSCIVNPDGKYKTWEVKNQDQSKFLGAIYFHYPMVGNSYFKYLQELVRKAQSAGIKDFYFDTFAYSYWSHYARWTYDRWDNRSCDIDEKTWTIKHKKADLAILVQDAWCQLFDEIEANGGKVISNHSVIPAKMRERLPKLVNFYEGRGGQLARARHLNQPTTLGYYPGYRYLEPYDTAAKMFANVMENLESGLLTYIYWPSVAPVDKPTICRHLFPITIKNIYAGCIEGKEKIITSHSGTYGFGSEIRPTVYIYDAEGVEHQATGKEALFSKVDGETVVKVTVPEGGAAVILNGESLDSVLIDEIQK